MQNFKVGDWVISTSCVDPDPNKITKIELATAPDEEDFVFFGNKCCVELKYIKKWIPKNGEWCWFLTVNSGYVLGQFIQEIGNGRYRYKLNTSDNALFNCSNCEPFIGELPSGLKELK